MATTEYAEFLRKKSQLEGDFGFEPVFMPDFLFDFQKYDVEWSTRKGRGASFADCGLGKTPMQLARAENIVRHTNGKVLILTPLAVASQTVEEGEKFGIEVYHSRDGKTKPGVNVTNYERLHLFDPDDFVGGICDESSSIKAMDGKRRKMVTWFLRKMKYRHLYSATPSPNDYIELGTSSEALGHLAQRDMLSMFFRSTDGLSHMFHKYGDFWNKHKWVFKPHAEERFWRWVCSWARAYRKPSDLGFDDGKFELPPLNIQQHVIDCSICHDGELFPRIATTLAEQREERRQTIEQRCAKVGELLDTGRPGIAWCQLNDEGDMLEQMIPGAVQVAGANSDDEKEERLLAFSHGEIKVLVTKPTIAGFGMNWQHCGDMTFFPSHSYEQYYQAVRRCLRFGRTGPVNVHIVTTPGEAGVTANLNQKAEAAAKMFDRLVAEMHNSLHVTRDSAVYSQKEEVPSWL